MQPVDRLAHPNRVAGLILISPAIGLGGGLSPVMRWVLSTPQARRLGSLFVRRAAGNVDEALSQAWDDPGKVTLEIIEGYRRPLRTEGWERGLWELTRAVRPAEVEARLHEIRTQVLLITGPNDCLVPTAHDRPGGEVPGYEARRAPGLRPRRP
jgi:pimeloyl-ACP methyl ester carboxylesterase